MTRNELIKKLEELCDELSWNAPDDLTECARERAYIDLKDAIEKITENEED